MKIGMKLYAGRQSGSVLVLVMIALVILMASGVAMMAVSYGVRKEAIQAKSEAVAVLAAEAGYERAVFRMSQQPDLLTALSDDDFESSESISIIKQDEEGYEGDDSEQTGTADYTISFDSFMGARPVYKVSSTGHCGIFYRTVDVYVIQAVSGWDMGMCRVPMGTTTTQAVYYVNGEVIDMPLHINCYNDEPYDDERDIWISGSPDFRRVVTMSESQYDSEGSDKYADVMDLFDEGIYFMQPSSRIMDRDVVQEKIDNFEQTLQSQKPQFIYTPTENSSVTNAAEAVQIEFFVSGGVGKVRITNNCTVRGGDAGNYDYKIDDDYEDLRFEKYNIYGYHYIPEDAETNGDRVTYDVTDTYVTPTYGDVEGQPGGQIYVNGNVVIGGNSSAHSGNQQVKGRITIVATGNIWIADTVLLDGAHGGDDLPSEGNENALGLVAQGVVKVIDPGKITSCLSKHWVSGVGWVYDMPEISGLEYEPVANQDGASEYSRLLPQSTELEASVTVSGGGWGAENVGSRKDNGSSDNYLVVRGTITEAVRGVVGAGSNGYKKRYYLDERLLEGILPGDIWLKGKYIPAPAGWHDYRAQL
jgi:hypothetical protein